VAVARVEIGSFILEVVSKLMRINLLKPFDLLCGILAIGFGFKQKKDRSSDPSVEKILEELVAIGPGIHYIIKNSEGEVVSCVAVGQAIILSHPFEARDIALYASKEAAKWYAYREFANWFSIENTSNQLNESSDVQNVEQENRDGIFRNEYSCLTFSELPLIHMKVDGVNNIVTSIFGWKNPCNSDKVLETISARFESEWNTEDFQKTLDRIWINEVLVIENIIVNAKETDYTQYVNRQWRSDGRSLLEVLSIASKDNVENGLEIKGGFWDDEGKIISINPKNEIC
jgi:hypothetical protein